MSDTSISTDTTIDLDKVERELSNYDLLWLAANFIVEPALREVPNGLAREAETPSKLAYASSILARNALASAAFHCIDTPPEDWDSNAIAWPLEKGTEDSSEIRMSELTVAVLMQMTALTKLALQDDDVKTNLLTRLATYKYAQ